MFPHCSWLIDFYTVDNDNDNKATDEAVLRKYMLYFAFISTLLYLKRKLLDEQFTCLKFSP